MKKLIILAVVVFGFAATSFAQNKANAGVFAKIEAPATAGGGGGAATPHSIGWVTDMDFGIITNTTTGGTVRLDAASGAFGTPTGGLTVPSNGTVAQFLVKGASTSIAVTYPTVLTLTGNGTSMTLNIAKATDESWTPTSTPGEYNLKIGGTLTVPAGAWGGYTCGSGLTVTVTNF
jgi:hypothetical protein